MPAGAADQRIDQSTFLQEVSEIATLPHAEMLLNKINGWVQDYDISVGALAALR